MPDRPHVVITTRSIAPLHGVGGLEQHGFDLVRHLRRRHVGVTVITKPPEHAGADVPLRDAGVALRLVPYWTFPFAGRRGTTVVDRSTAYLWFGRRVGRLAAQIVSGGGVDIVHGMGASVLGYAAAREADWYETVPLVLNPHGLEEFGSTGPGLSAAKHLVYAPLRRAVRNCARAADRVIATDAVMVPSVRDHLGVPESRIAVVPNAVDLERVDAHVRPGAGASMRARHGIGAGELVFLSIGRLEANKGYHVLLEALRRLSASEAGGADARWRLVLVGDGSERARLERDCAAAGLRDRVLLTGRVADADLHLWYEAGSLFVHPSLYEGSSIVTLEAMAHRLPVVATTAGGLRDKVRPGVNGWLVQPGDSGALADALREASADRDCLPALGAASRSIVEGEFSWDAAIDQLLGVYQETLRHRGSPERARE